jgi:DNA-binding MarR family transcriptional regulator
MMTMKDESGVPGAEQAIDLLHLCVRLLHGFGLRELNDAGLRPPQVAFLGFLHKAGTLNISTISKFTNVTVSVATRFIERLEAKGLVERVPDENDRRVVLVRLTGEGDRLAGEVHKTISQNLNKALEGIDRHDFEVFLAVLSHINEKLASALPTEHISEMMAAHMHDVKG